MRRLRDGLLGFEGSGLGVGCERKGSEEPSRGRRRGGCALGGEGYSIREFRMCVSWPMHVSSVKNQLRDLLYALPGNALALLHGQRVVGRLQLYEWPPAYFPRMYHGFQV